MVLTPTRRQGRPSYEKLAVHALIAARGDLSAEGIDLWVVNPRQKRWKLVVAMMAAANEATPEVFASLNDAVGRFENISAIVGG